MRRIVGVWVTTSALVCCVGCSQQSSVVEPDLSSDASRVAAPIPNSPANAMRLFEWSYDHRAFDPYRRVFTGDFRFVMTLQDSNGAGYRDDSWLYEDEMVSARHLFEGGGPQPAATRIALDLDPVLVFVDDPRPGKDPWFHKTTSTHFALKVRTRGNRMYDISGFADFYLVRGDSAAVPVGEPPADSTRWFIERWEDRSLNGDWGALKRAYR